MAPPVAAITPPEISAPKLVTSTNPATESSLTINKEEDDWHSKYLQAKVTCKKLRTQLKDQAKKSRQLIVVVKTKLQNEEEEKLKQKELYDTELSNLCQQLLSVQALMLNEQNRVETLLNEKDRLICKQTQELDKLRNDISPPKPAVPTSNTTNNNNVSVTNLSPVSLGGSLRIHGSFRQYKKDREKFRQHLKSGTTTTTTFISDSNRGSTSSNSSSSSSSSGINVSNSSEDSSSSPSTLPRTQKSSLRQCSSLQIEDTSSPKKKGILKASVSIDNTTTTGQDYEGHQHFGNSPPLPPPPPPPPSLPAPAKEQEPSPPAVAVAEASRISNNTILENLQQLITATEPPSLQPQLQRTASTKIRIHPELVVDHRSDSGRESDDIEPSMPPPEKSKTISVVTVSTDSANSSFDANDPTLLAWKINIAKDHHYHHPVAAAENYSHPLKKKVKPPPPPRSSQTKLSSVQQLQLKPKSILSPTSSLNPEMSPTEALDHLIHNIDSHNNNSSSISNNRLRSSEKKKRVKFNPRVDTSKAPPEPPPEDQDFEDPQNLQTTQPLDPNFLHFLPRLMNQKQDLNKNAADQVVTDDSKKKNFSYYEPYI